MGKQRQRHSEEFKAKVAMAAVKGDRTLSELAQQYHLHPTQINQWKQRLLSGASELFQGGRVKKSLPREAISRPVDGRTGVASAKDFQHRRQLSDSSWSLVMSR